MAVYYHKLWQMLSDKKMTHKELIEKASLSTATIFQMKRNEFISLSVLDRITKVLKCNYGDLITNEPIPEEYTSEWLKVVNLKFSRRIVLEAVKEYMELNEFSIKDLLEITNLSLNTVKKFFRGEPLSQNSYHKLLRLGEDFSALIKKKCGGNVFSFI